ncbi:hypothetical protein BGX26_007007 [Mortierella sp. AD094]|nr:hypothetical protein BGX26_007007 [Mortierella sp. AD094]
MNLDLDSSTTQQQTSADDTKRPISADTVDLNSGNLTDSNSRSNSDTNNVGNGLYIAQLQQRHIEALDNVARAASTLQDVIASTDPEKENIRQQSILMLNVWIKQRNRIGYDLRFAQTPQPKYLDANTSAALFANFLLRLQNPGSNK